MTIQPSTSVGPGGLYLPVSQPQLQPPVINLRDSSYDALALNDETNGQWVRGFAYLPEGNQPPSGFFPCATVDVSSVPANNSAVYWQPFVTWTGITCSTLGWQAFDWQGRAQRLLDVGTPKALEHEFWSGEWAKAAGFTDGMGSDNPNLWLAMSAISDSVSSTPGNFGPVDLTPASGPVSTFRAFAMLEQAIADSGLGARGMIHTRPEAAPGYLAVRRDGDLLLTQNDTIVVAGTGYPNLGPGGTTPVAGNVWLYATGIPQVRVDRVGPNNGVQLYPNPLSDGDPDWYIKALDKGTNTLTVRAERFASVSWDGTVHFAVQAVLPT